MKGNHRQPTAAAPSAAPLSPTSKATAKYTNKDGSKFITVPKTSAAVEPSQPSPSPSPATVATPAASARIAPRAVPEAASQESRQPVNRKKQKRRAKAAAKAAAEQPLSTTGPSNGLPSPPPSHEPHSADAEPDDSNDEDDQFEGGHPRHHHSHQNGFAKGSPPQPRKTKKKKGKDGTGQIAEGPPIRYHYHPPAGQSHAHISAPTASSQHHHHRPGMSKEKIWNTSSQEERERIKEFWLGLSESERKSLVKVEKEAVLKKMKEQQKHTCSCTVCGRKRHAIEEELEGLYDAYYEELEQYANHPSQGDGPPMLRPRHSFSSTAGMRGGCSLYSNHQPSRGQIVDQTGDDEEEVGDEDLSEDDIDDDDEVSEEEPSEPLHRTTDYAADFFNFGNSLTVEGGILTVADDLLKNDGKKFIEMMEQLAERRMAREEDAREQYERGYDHTNGDRFGHTHPPAAPEEEEYDDDEEEYDEEDEDEYDSQEEEQDTMTEEQRMEEGRRMFQIFAARMFEQRVLTAYREKVAKERQAKLLEEIEDENRQESQRKAKKAKEAQKRKDKAAKKKEALAEEKARKEQEKAAEEEARAAEEKRKAEEQRVKLEEKKRKKELQKKAEEEERQKQNAERLRRLQEQEELQRRAREAKEREKKAREEARLKEKEARDKKELQAQERREQQERDKRDKEARARSDREAKEVKDKRKQDEKAAQKAAALAAAAPVPLPVTLPKRPASNAMPPALPQQTSTSYASPKPAVATPALPKVPTPMRLRQASQQEGPASSSSGAASQAGSAPSQNPSPHPITPVHVSPGPIGPPVRSINTGASTQSGPHQSPHSASPLNTTAKLPHQSSPFSMPPMMPFLQGMPQMPPGFTNHHRDPMFPPMTSFRPAPPGMMPMPPGFGSQLGGRGIPMHPPPGFPGPLDSPMSSITQPFSPSIPKESMASHSRQGSASYEPGAPISAQQPIGRPAPIGRPSSVVQGQRPPSQSPRTGFTKPELEGHLGSSALLDGLDEPLQEYPTRRLPIAPAPLGQRLGQAFPMSPFGVDPIFTSQHSPWAPAGGPQPHMFGPPPPPGFGPGPMPWGPPAPISSTFGGHSVSVPRSVHVRKMLSRACRELADSESKKVDGSEDGFISLDNIRAQVQLINSGQPVDEAELLDMCETEGNEVNGGGSFDVREDRSGKMSIRYVDDGRSNPRPHRRAVGAPGEIGSPIVGGGSFGGRC
ncbi:salt tolerance down-regulator-domain-containing protein [Podospora didyma]|uniref:Stress response protein NST1 n=1 Tax=Podospora didyma TaxID=330526 RepID=A0AAE0U4F6_9PEZI|nr:salt tolerance down-regulator-domain-containing protein [Podospora didyma]